MEQTSKVDAAREAIEQAAQAWREEEALLKQLEADAARVAEQRLAAARELEHQADASKSTYHELMTSTVPDLEIEAERITVRIRRTKERLDKERQRYKAAVCAEKEARLEASISGAAASRNAVLGSLAVFLKQYAIAQRHLNEIAAIQHELRNDRVRTDRTPALQQEQLTAQVRSMHIERLVHVTKDGELRECVQSMIEGFGFAPYTGSLPYSHGTQLRDLLDWDGTAFNNRARDYEARSTSAA